MYFRGEHVEKDGIEDYTWMHVSLAEGDENFLRLKNLIDKNLSEKEQHAAASLSEQYIKKYGNAALAISFAPKTLSDKECTQASKVLEIT